MYIFSPHLGASLYINGHNVASLTNPAIFAPHNNLPTPLCFGLCGANPGVGSYNFTMGNIVCAGANVATLAKNYLLGLLGTRIQKCTLLVFLLSFLYQGL